MNFDFLALGAHPDDIELGCAGTLIKLARLGYRTAAITLTRGESGTRGTPEIRAREFELAAQHMLLTHSRMLDLPDAAIAETQLNKLKLVQVMRELRPQLVATVHWQARHPDHIHTSHLVRDAAMLAGLKNLDMKPLREATRSAAERNAIETTPAWYPRRVLFFPERYEAPISFIVDITDAFEQKMAAIRAHESQFYNANMAQYGDEQTSISRPEFLEFIEHQNQRWGDMIGVKYGEAFYLREAVRLDDPIAAFGEWCEHTFP
ncbi:bacillithiol biosynthesis deacetylase BshB1 [candidate division KSB1 bacterium]|nr:bacillithiol biosynthesis deacetylase BshB1 [candidate division KSB1 bacterium]